MLLSLQEVSVRFERRIKQKSPLFRPRWLRGPGQSATQNALVLDDLSLNVEENDFLAVLGPSGSGKTTLLRTIAGLTTPSSGRIVLNSTDITLQPPHKRQVSLVFQNGGWYDHLTVEQHFDFDGLSKDEIQHSLMQLDLTSVRNLQPAELSGGQAQRLAIGRALARNCPVLLLDEPLSQLDQSIREPLRQMLRSIHAQGRTLVYVTHDQNDAMLLASKIAVLHRGKIQQIGSPQELFDTPNHRSVAEMIGQPNMQFFDVRLEEADRSNLLASLRSTEPYLSGEILRSIERQMIREDSQHVRGSALNLGIRPDAWRIDNEQMLTNDDKRKRQLGFTATFVEERFFGYQRLLRFKASDAATTMIQVLNPRTIDTPRLACGKQYRLCVAYDDLHWFTAETGDRLDHSN